MMTVIKRLWSDQGGAVISIELVLVSSVVLLGLMVGLAALRDSVNNELADVGGAIDEITQSYTGNSIQGHSAAVSGSAFQDGFDFCDAADDAAGTTQGCITFVAPGADEATFATTPTGA